MVERKKLNRKPNKKMWILGNAILSNKEELKKLESDLVIAYYHLYDYCRMLSNKTDSIESDIILLNAKIRNNINRIEDEYKHPGNI